MEPNNKPLESGDAGGLWCFKRYHGDHAYSSKLGEVAPETKKLLQVTKGILVQEFANSV
jgi:methionyl aminopeptidase